MRKPTDRLQSRLNAVFIFDVSFQQPEVASLSFACRLSCMCEVSFIAPRMATRLCKVSPDTRGSLTVLMTSLSVLTTQGWMMVVPLVTATTGGLSERMWA